MFTISLLTTRSTEPPQEKVSWFYFWSHWNKVMEISFQSLIKLPSGFPDQKGLEMLSWTADKQPNYWMFLQTKSLNLWTLFPEYFLYWCVKHKSISFSHNQLNLQCWQIIKNGGKECFYGGKGPMLYCSRRT